MVKEKQRTQQQTDPSTSTSSSMFMIKSRRSLRSERSASPLCHDDSNDEHDMLERSRASTNSQSEYNQTNNSDNESFNNKSKSNKFIYEELKNETATTTDIYDRNPEGAFHRRTRSESIRTLQPARSENVNNSFGVILAIIALIVGVLVIWYFSQKTDRKIECPQFQTLSKQYAHQELLLWKSLKNNIENVLNQTPAQPSVFLLAYNDRPTVEHIMADIINATAQCMHSRDPIQLHGKHDLADPAMIKDYGVIVNSYRERLNSEGIMYVADLHETPAAVAQAFHTICDTITPLVHKSVIFFTFYVEVASAERDRTMSPKHVHELVEAKLYHNWDAINHNTLHALIGRVTDQVFFLHSES